MEDLKREVGRTQLSEALAEQMPQAGQSLTLGENGHPQGARIQKSTEDVMIIEPCLLSIYYVLGPGLGFMSVLI